MAGFDALTDLHELVRRQSHPEGKRPNGEARRKMVFVGGLHRSGTTHLAKLLGKHPDASVMTKTGVMMDEGQFLQDVYPQDWQTGGPGAFAYSPAAHQIEQQDPDKAEAMRARLMQQWAPYWDMSQSVLIEKTPGNLLSARFLQSVFGEDSYFVFITRHPIAVSLATRKWSQTSLFALIDHWLVAHDIVRKDLPHLRNVIWVSYEQLVNDPTGTLAEIQNFIGMRPITAPALPTEDANQGYFATWKTYYLTGPGQAPQRTPSGKATRPSLLRRLFWFIRGRARHYLLLRRGLDFLATPNEARAILARFETQVREFGYSLADLNRHPASVSSSPAPVHDDVRELASA